MQRIQALKTNFKGLPCIGLQLDMWTDSETHTSFVCVTMTTVCDPRDGKAPNAQLYLRSEIVDFNVFPQTEKTGENIKAWFLTGFER